MRNITLALALLSMVPVSSLSAQAAAAVEPGQRVRLTYTPTCPAQTVCAGFLERIGTVVSWDGDTLQLDARGRTSPQAQALNVPRSSIVRLDVSRGQKSNAWLGAGIGLLAGAGIGAIAGASAFSDECLLGPPGCPGSGALLGGTSLGLIGAGIGALVGSGNKTDRWEEVPLDRLSASFAPQRDGRFAFAASIRF